MLHVVDQHDPLAPPDVVRVRARRKRNSHAPTSGDWVTLTRKDLSSFFNLSLHDAAHALSLSATCLKTVCRRLGIRRWPYARGCRFDSRPFSLPTPTSSPASFEFDESLPPEDSSDADLWFLAAGHHFDEGTDFSYLLASG